MSKFDFLSKDNSLNIDEFMKKQAAFAVLKSSELDNISENEIVLAVSSWIEGKFAEDWSDMCEVMNGLPTPCLNLYCADYVTKEVMNGGFSQAFFNSSRDFVGGAAEGFRAIGYMEAADIFKRALKVHFDSNKKSVGDSIEDFLEFSDNDEFNEIDVDFYSIFSDEKFNALAYQYIIKYRKYFGEQ